MRIIADTNRYPCLTEWHVRRALKWIDDTHLAGLDCISLVDEDPQERGGRAQPPYLRGFTFNGRYVKQGNSARIYIYTHDIYLCIPTKLSATPVATLRVARILAHEVGHHLVETKGHIYSPREKYKPYGKYDEYKEEMCDKYAAEVLAKLASNWYYKLGRFLSRRLSDYFHARGEVMWDKQRYDGAARNWFCAYMIENTNREAANLYHKAIKMLLSAGTHEGQRSRVPKPPPH
jgi:hypothetical protein